MRLFSASIQICFFLPRFLLSFLFSCLFSSVASASPQGGPIQWQDWSEDAFTQARTENKLVLLNLEAVWCHWCHVMDQKTYGNPEVAALIKQHYIPIKVDHDARPDLANQYRDYGWPATIFLDAQGTDLVKRAGYIQPDNFARLLNAIVADPTPERAAQQKVPDKFALEPQLQPKVLTELLARHRNLYDSELGGLKSSLKTLDRDHVEYALLQARRGDVFETQVAQKTIKASFALVDPEWGGIYQYSTHGDWQHAHFEKIMTSQAGFLRIYALAYQQFGDAEYLKQAHAIVQYLGDFLTAPSGAFYTSQDADLNQGEKATEYFALTDRARRSQGIPRIDQNIYARENGMAIEALAALYEASGDPSHLRIATTAANVIRQTHQRADGGFRHSAADKSGQYPELHLGDTLYMGAAFLQLHKVTGERIWLAQAERCGRYIASHFKADTAGFLSGLRRPNFPVQPVRHIEENIKATRFLNLLGHYTGEETIHRAAAHGMRYLATTEIALGRIEDSGILIAAEELTRPPPHYTIVGKRNSVDGKKIFAVGLAEAGWYKRIEWWDKTEGPLRNSDVTYPDFDKPAGYICIERLCSAPAFTQDRYRELVNRLIHPTR